MSAETSSPKSLTVGVISTSRADAGIYRPLLRTLVLAGFRPTVLAGGTHLSEEHGSTVDGFGDLDGTDVIRIDHFSPGSDPASVASHTGRATVEFGKALSRFTPGLVFVLGDRTEMLGAALAAVIHRIPIAHLHGGERTRGAYDDACRDAITKLSDFHFVALPEYADRIHAMNEPPDRVHVVGALALDDLVTFRPHSVEQTSETVGQDLSQPTFVVAYHVETRAAKSAERQINEVLAALRDREENLLFIGTNVDVGSGAIDKAIREFVADHPRARFLMSLDQAVFWSCLSHARLLVGNSSAGIIEAASLKLPVVNIGLRQDGRVRAANVIDVDCEAAAIVPALNQANTMQFRSTLTTLQNPYGDGKAAQRIVETLNEIREHPTNS